MEFCALFLMKFLLKIGELIMIYKKFFILLCFYLFFFSSCTSVKNALTGKKTENSDEFLVKKKNPLVLPPDYDDLPEPNEKDLPEELEDDTDVEKLIRTYDDVEENKNLSTSKSIEKFVLDNINKD